MVNDSHYTKGNKAFSRGRLGDGGRELGERLRRGKEEDCKAERGKGVGFEELPKTDAPAIT